MALKYLGILDENDPIRQEVWYDEFTDEITFRDVQDVEPILKMNRVERNMEHGQKFGEWKKVATIPNIVVNQLMKEGIWQDRGAFKRWLNKSEFSNFRTKEGRL